MTVTEIQQILQKKIPEIKLELQCGQAGESWILVSAVDLVKVIKILKDDLGMNYLACLSGIDYGDSLGVVYILRSLTNKFEIMVKTLTPKEDPTIPTLSTLYASADWFEREAYDLLGIHFQNHPDLRRILMPEDWVGYPLRKDYQQPAEYNGIPCDRPDTHKLLEQLYTIQSPGNSGQHKPDSSTTSADQDNGKDLSASGETV